MSWWTHDHTAVLVFVYGLTVTWALVAYARRSGR